MAHIFTEKERTADVTLCENVTFESLLLSENIFKGLKADGFVRPSPIQLRAIPTGRCGFDVVMRSKSGTGKTLVFAILALEMIDTSRDVTQVLILTPTREIAVQIQGVIKKIGILMPGLKVKSFIGGLPIEDDKKNLKGCHIAIGAPGRIKHLITSHVFKTDHIKLFVLDEADKLVDQNFQSDINHIYNKLPARKQVIASSATYPDHLDQFLTRYMQSPTYISTDADGSVLLGLKQFVSLVKFNSNVVQQLKFKNERLNEILSKTSFTQCLVFTNYQIRAESISNILNQKGWNSSFISAAQEQKKRLEVVDNLKKFNCRILLSTDLTARGIDAANVDLVINYDVPYDAATYLHRMGRAGRYGSKGVCITICSDKNELSDLKCILGEIGGKGMSVAKLEQVPADLLNCDYNTFEKIYGEVATKNVNQKVENSQSENKLETKNSITAMRDAIFDPETAEAILREPSEEKTEKVDLIFSSQQQSEDRDIIPSASAVVRRQESLQNNLLLYNLSKLLVTSKVDNEIVDSVEKFLKNIELEDQSHHTQPAKSLTTEKESQNNCSENTNLKDDVQTLEIVFEKAYAHACDESEQKTKHWLLFFSEDVRNDFENFCKPPVSELVCEKNDDDDDEYDGGVDDEMMETSYYDSEEEVVEFEEHVTSSSYQEVAATQEGVDSAVPPVAQNVQQDLIYQEQFETYFNACGNLLEETALTFEDLASFDHWFYNDWQIQVARVRDFVQQNIYVREMSQYQNQRDKN